METNAPLFIAKFVLLRLTSDQIGDLLITIGRVIMLRKESGIDDATTAADAAARGEVTLKAIDQAIEWPPGSERWMMPPSHTPPQ